MATEDDITAALFARIAALSLTPAHPIAWPNVAFNPPPNNRWLRVNEVPTLSQPVAVSQDGSNDYRGFVQIDVFAPLGGGLAGPKATAGLVRQWMKRGTVLFSGSTRVLITSASIQGGIESSPRWMVPVVVDYRAFALNA